MLFLDTPQVENHEDAVPKLYVPYLGMETTAAKEWRANTTHAHAGGERWNKDIGMVVSEGKAQVWEIQARQRW